MDDGHSAGLGYGPGSGQLRWPGGQGQKKTDARGVFSMESGVPEEEDRRAGDRSGCGWWL